MIATHRFVPDYRLKLNGEQIPAALRNAVTSVRYQDGTQAADRVEFDIANVEGKWLREHIKGLGFRPFPTGVSSGGFTFEATPEGLFDVDNRLDLSIGYADDRLVDVFEGEITGVNASFPAGGMPTMTVVAHDYLHRTTQGKYARGFGPLPDALIVAILGAENRLIPLIDPALQGASAALAAVNYIFGGAGRKQNAQSDLELLKEIAGLYDADFWVEGDLLYFSRFVPKEYTPRLTLGWGSSLMDFSPKVSTIGRIAGVSMKFTLREIPLSFVVTVFWDFDREVLGMNVTPGEAAAGTKAVSGPTFTIIDHPIASPADIAHSAMAITRELRNKLNNRLTATGTAVGDPRIRAGAMITIEGVGPNFSGDYRVASATHSLDAGGYRTAFEVRKEIIP